MPDVLINDQTYYGIEKVKIPRADGDGNAEFKIPVVSPLEVTSNGEYSVPDGVDGYNRVKVQVPASGPNTSDATAVASDIVNGKTAYTGAGKITGTMTDNGTVNKVLDASTPSYTVPAGKHSGSGKVSIETEIKTVTPSKSQQTINPSTGKVLSRVTVNPIPSNYIEPSGTLNVTNNGTHNVTQYASVNVNVPTGGGGANTSDATAIASDILSGKTAYIGSGKVTGTMANRGVMDQTIDGINKTNVPVSAGYYSGGSVNFDSSAIEALLDAL